MVKVEFLNDIPIQQSTKRRQPTVENGAVNRSTSTSSRRMQSSTARIARDCAASQIQAIVRGVLVKLNNCNRRNQIFSNDQSNSSTQTTTTMAITTSSSTSDEYCQVGRSLVELNETAAQTDKSLSQAQAASTTAYQSSSSGSNSNSSIKSREEAIMKAHEMYNPSMNGVCIGPEEILNILKAADILDDNVHQSLTRKIILDSSISIRYFVRLSGAVEFEQDLMTACRKILTDQGYCGGGIEPIRRVGFKHLEDANDAKESILQIVDVSNDTLQYLIRNKDIMSYSDAMINEFLSLLGLDCANDIGASGDRTMTEISALERLDCYFSQKDYVSSWDRARIEVASELVHCIVDWEKANGTVDTVNMRRKLQEAHTKIYMLKDEVEMLRVQMQGLLSRQNHKDEEKATPDSIENVEPQPFVEALQAEAKTGAKIVDGISSVKDINKTKAEPKRHISVHKPPIKTKSATQRTVSRSKRPSTSTSKVRPPSGIRPQKISVVDITFDRKLKKKAVRNPARPKVVQRPKTAPTQRRRNSSRSTRQRADVTLSSTLKKSREKRNLERSSYRKENSAPVGDSYQSPSMSPDRYSTKTLKAPSQSRSPLGSTNTASASERFNSILERLNLDKFDSA